MMPEEYAGLPWQERDKAWRSMTLDEQNAVTKYFEQPENKRPAAIPPPEVEKFVAPVSQIACRIIAIIFFISAVVLLALAFLGSDGLVKWYWLSLIGSIISGFAWWAFGDVIKFLAEIARGFGQLNKR